MKASLIPFVISTTLSILSGTHARQGSVRALRQGRVVDSSVEPTEPGVHPQASRDLQSTFPVVNSTKGLGTKSFYFIRISCRDCAPHPFTLNQLINTHFRTDTTSFKTVIEDCSFGKLRVVSNGGIDVTVDGGVANYGHFGDWVLNATAKADAALGRSVYTMADQIFFCSPRNVTSLTAVALQNGNRIHANSLLCQSLSTMMHEFGHNMNLLHSGIGNDEYADVTGMMGFSKIDSNFPAMCYNSYKHYQLRWFEDRHLNLVDFTTPRRIQLAAFADYDKTNSQHAVIVNVAGIFFLQYNRAKRNNRETQLRANLVTYVQNRGGGTASNLDGGMGVGGTIVRNHNGKTLFVAVCQRVDAPTTSDPDVMVITIGYNKNWCGLI